MEEQVGYGNLKAVTDFEKTYPELAKEFQQIQREQYELFASKMMDYGLSNISLGSTLEKEEDINFKDKLPIICYEHGVFYKRKAAHITQEEGCPLCSKNRFIKKEAKSLFFL